MHAVGFRAIHATVLRPQNQLHLCRYLLRSAMRHPPWLCEHCHCNRVPLCCMQAVFPSSAVGATAAMSSSYALAKYIGAAALNCAQGVNDREACNAVANLCVLQMYRA